MTNASRMEQLQERLRQLRSANPGAEGMENTSIDPQLEQKILKERAQHLASFGIEKTAAPQTAAGVDLLIFSHGASRYGVEFSCIESVAPVPRITTLPATPACLLGVAYSKGQVIPVVNLTKLLNAPPVRAAEAAALLILRHGASRLGILASELDEFVREEIDRPPEFPLRFSPAVAELLKGETKTHAVVLNLTGIVETTSEALQL